MNPVLRSTGRMSFSVATLALLAASPGTAQSPCSQIGAMSERCLLLQQSAHAALGTATILVGDDPASAILEIDRKVIAKQRALTSAETANFGVPLAGAVIISTPQSGWFTCGGERC